MTPPLYRPGDVVYLSGTTLSSWVSRVERASAIYVSAHLVHRSYSERDSTTYQMADGNTFRQERLHPTFEAAEAAARASLT